jgi:hypothetical protein
MLSWLVNDHCSINMPIELSWAFTWGCFGRWIRSESYRLARARRQDYACDAESEESGKSRIENERRIDPFNRSSSFDL